MREIPGGVALPAGLIGGDDLLAMGLPEGPRVGKLLRAAYDAQLNGELTTRRQAMAWVRRRVDEA